MKVLVTGGTGSVGGFVVDELQARGHEVTVGGRTPDKEVEGARYVTLDVTDFEAVRETVEGHQAVIHLAAMPTPQRGKDHVLFGVNCAGTFNVFEACGQLGVRRVVNASSINWLGERFGRKPVPIQYFPIDEAHPGLPTDSYSFSKHVAEQIATYAWERHQVSSVSIRIPAVIEPGDPKYVKAWRTAREKGDTDRMAPDFWVYVDGRDSAAAFVLGVEAEFDGAHPIFVNDDYNCYGLPSRELAAKAYPTVTEWREPIAGDEALVSCRRAKELLGWEPRYSWRGVAAGGDPP